MNENVIEWLNGDEYMIITAPNASRLKGKVLKLAETNSDIKVIRDNPDGSIMAKVPVRCLSLRNPREISEEERERLARMSAERHGRSV